MSTATTHAPTEPSSGASGNAAELHRADSLYRRRVDNDLRAIGRVLEQQAVALDRLAAEGARVRMPDWRAFLEMAHRLRIVARSLPR